MSLTARLRWGRLLVTAAQLSLPVLLVVLTFLDFAPRQHWEWSHAAGPIVLLIICVWRWGVGRYRPYAWPLTATWMSGIAGIYLTTGVHQGLLDELTRRIDNPKLVGLVSALAFVFPVIAVGCAWSLAWLGRRIVLMPFTVELADSPVEIPFRSRLDGRVRLRIRHDTLILDGRSVRLADIGTVELFTHDVYEPWTYGPSSELALTITQGPAVRFEVLGGAWAFPTEQGSEIAEVIKRRRPIPAPQQQFRRVVRQRRADEPDAVEEVQREANQRVADALIRLRSAPAAEVPAARANLRRACDQSIAELIRGSDSGDQLLRRRAAEIRRLRDRHCHPPAPVEVERARGHG